MNRKKLWIGAGICAVLLVLLFGIFRYRLGRINDFMDSVENRPAQETGQVKPDEKQPDKESRNQETSQAPKESGDEQKPAEEDKPQDEVKPDGSGQEEKPAQEPEKQPAQEPEKQPAREPEKQPEKKPETQPEKTADPEAQVQTPAGYQGTYRIDVNIGANVVTIYEKSADGKYDKPIKAMVCSAGRPDSPTPTGDYFIPDFRSEVRTLFGGVYGIYTTNIVGNILFHSVPAAEPRADTIIGKYYNQLGTNASAGCIRLAVPDAKWIFDNAPTGTWVHIYSNPGYPGPLGKPTPMKMKVEYGKDPHYN